MNAIVQINEAGDAELGAKIDGVFVPFVTLPAFRVAQLSDARKDTDTDTAEKKPKGGK